MASAPASELFPKVQTLLELVMVCVGTLALALRLVFKTPNNANSSVHEELVMVCVGTLALALRLVFKTPNNATSSVHEPWDVEALQYANTMDSTFGMTAMIYSHRQVVVVNCQRKGWLCLANNLRRSQRKHAHSSGPSNSAAHVRVYTA